MKPFILLFALATTGINFAEPPSPKPTDVVLVDGAECPSAPGVYLARAGGWKKMEEVHSSAVVKSGLRLRRRPTHTKAIFPDSTAPERVNAAAAIFCVVDLADHARDLLMYRLDPNGGRRELELGTGADDPSAKNRMHPEPRQVADRTFILQAPLGTRPGEYALFSRDQLTAF